jgi:hypothetical protein
MFDAWYKAQNEDGDEDGAPTAPDDAPLDAKVGRVAPLVCRARHPCRRDGTDNGPCAQDDLGGESGVFKIEQVGVNRLEGISALVSPLVADAALPFMQLAWEATQSQGKIVSAAIGNSVLVIATEKCQLVRVARARAESLA